MINIGWCIKFATGVEMEIFVVCVITFEPIEIQTCSSPQNDSLNLSFVKDENIVGEKMTRNGRKMAIRVASNLFYCSLLDFVHPTLSINTCSFLK